MRCECRQMMTKQENNARLTNVARTRMHMTIATMTKTQQIIPKSFQSCETMKGVNGVTTRAPNATRKVKNICRAVSYFSSRYVCVCLSVRSEGFSCSAVNKLAKYIWNTSFVAFQPRNVSRLCIVGFFSLRFSSPLSVRFVVGFYWYVTARAFSRENVNECVHPKDDYFFSVIFSIWFSGFLFPYQIHVHFI